MIIYHDFITNDEILTDSYNMKLVNDFYWEVDTNYVEQKGMEISDSMIGGNASAEDVPEDLEEADVKRGFEVVLKNDLSEFGFESTKKFKSHLKKILAKCKDKLDPEYFSGEFKKKMGDFMKEVVEPKFDNLQFFFGTNAVDVEFIACPILLDCSPDGSKAKMYFLKDMLVEEKA